LSTELVTLRNRLHVSQPAATLPPPPHAITNNNSSNNNNNSNNHSNNLHSTAPCTVANNQQPVVPPRHTALPNLPQHINTVEPFIGTTGKCHQQRLTSEKKTATSISQHHQHIQHQQQQQQPPLPSLVNAPEDNQQQSSQQQQVTVAMRPVGCAELEDLIHLAGPLTEDAVLKCLQARFCASQFFVSIYILYFI
ncbi:hypothetical protein C0J52_05398, partial [Blattella germanica]